MTLTVGQLLTLEPPLAKLVKEPMGARAAFRVGYHDASHFNREYKSLFGLPPMRDLERLRDSAAS